MTDEDNRTSSELVMMFTYLQIFIINFNRLHNGLLARRVRVTPAICVVPSRLQAECTRSISAEHQCISSTKQER